MAAISTYRRRAPKRSTRRLWLALVLSLAVVLATFAVGAATVQAGSFDNRPPKAVLMKGENVLRKGALGSYCWNWYLGDGRGRGECADGAFLSYPSPERVKAGSQLHIRLKKPQKPDKFKVIAYKGFDREKLRLVGPKRRIETTLKPVKRDGKTVGWDAYFRVNKPDRHYYLDTYGNWYQDPDTQFSYGDGTWAFHVKTR
jgi:hypothetical protein